MVVGLRVPAAMHPVPLPSTGGARGADSAGARRCPECMSVAYMNMNREQADAAGMIAAVHSLPSAPKSGCVHNSEVAAFMAEFDGTLDAAAILSTFSTSNAIMTLSE